MSNGRWRAAVNGPDWTDVRTMMGCIQELHKSSCFLELAPDGLGPGTALTVRACVLSNRPGEDLKPMELCTAGEWPNRAGQTLPALVLDLLYRLDHEVLVQWWEQGKMI
jgi:hypothetical protein